MVQLVAPPGAGDVIPLRRPQLEVSQACLADSEELAELLHTSPAQAVELAVAVILKATYADLACCVGAAPGATCDHKRGVHGV